MALVRRPQAQVPLDKLCLCLRVRVHFALTNDCPAIRGISRLCFIPLRTRTIARPRLIRASALSCIAPRQKSPPGGERGNSHAVSRPSPFKNRPRKFWRRSSRPSHAAAKQVPARDCCRHARPMAESSLVSGRIGNLAPRASPGNPFAPRRPAPAGHAHIPNQKVPARRGLFPAVFHLCTGAVMAERAPRNGSRFGGAPNSEPATSSCLFLHAGSKADRVIAPRPGRAPDGSARVQLVRPGESNPGIFHELISCFFRAKTRRCRRRQYVLTTTANRSRLHVPPKCDPSTFASPAIDAFVHGRCCI